MSREIPGPHDPAQMRRFLETFLYTEDAVLVDEIVRLDDQERAIEALLDTERPLPFTRRQRNDAAHPAHVSAPELVMATGSLGCMHAFFFHGCRWDRGWTAFGSRIHRADFRSLARIGPPLRLCSRETRTRVGDRRVVLRFDFRFWQDEGLVYAGDQTAMFLRYDESVGRLPTWVSSLG